MPQFPTRTTVPEETQCIIIMIIIILIIILTNTP